MIISCRTPSEETQKYENQFDTYIISLTCTNKVIRKMKGYTLSKTCPNMVKVCRAYPDLTLAKDFYNHFTCDRQVMHTRFLHSTSRHMPRSLVMDSSKDKAIQCIYSFKYIWASTVQQNNKTINPQNPKIFLISLSPLNNSKYGNQIDILKKRSPYR